MTKEEYKQQRKEISNEYLRKQHELAKKFALENNPYKIGDVVTDHIGSLRIKGFKIYTATEFPECVYVGTELKKDGTPMKKQTGREVYQNNIV